MTLKAVIVSALVVGLMLSAPPPAAAQDAVIRRVLVDVCLPYARRSQSFEKSIRAARDLGFRRPVGDNAPLEEWASEVDLLSMDGSWRLRIEEGTIEEGESQTYAVGCVISSRRASARELADLGRRAFNDDRYWTSPQDNPWRWDRRTSRPHEYGLAAEVSEKAGDRPTLTIKGEYR